MGLVPFLEPQESLIPFSSLHHERIQLEVGSLQPKGGLSSEFNCVGTLKLDFSKM